MGALPAPQPDWTLADWLAWQEQLHARAIDLGLDRIRPVAARLGLLTQKARTVTVAGTNGKGSTATLTAAIYRAAGYRVGLYTSPHLLRYNERVQIDGRMADDAALCRAFHAIDAAREGVTLTYFEFGTLAALWLFREADVQVQVLEVGLGGRLDAVNLVDADLAIITNIGLDHVEVLGPDRESIGREKAGILRAGRPVIVAERHPPASVLAQAETLGSPLFQLGRDYDYAPHDRDWDWAGCGTRWTGLPPPAMPGAVQLQNASGAVAAVTVLADTLPVTAAALHAGLREYRLPGRLQREGRFLLDVGHNAEAAQVLLEHLQALAPAGRVRLILGMLADKPVEQVAWTLAPIVETVYASGLPGPRGLSGEALAARLRHLGMNTELCVDVATAVARAQAAATEDDLIVVTGSFLTVAGALEVLHG